jgi:hypothetical protein
LFFSHFLSIFQQKKEEEKGRKKEREAIFKNSHRGSATPATESTSVATKSSALVRTIILMAQLSTAATASVSCYISLAQVVFLFVQLPPNFNQTDK